MANLNYILGNRLRDEAGDTITKPWLFGAVVVVIAFLIDSSLGVFAVAGLAAVLWANAQGSARLLHGAEGEDLALGANNSTPGSLATLPDVYTVFNQLVVPFKGGRAELDFVVVGPNGVFAVETKHDRGTIRGAEKDAQWSKTKISSGGNTYERESRNPVAQCKRAVYALRTYLESQGNRAWVHGLVVYTHPDCILEVESRGVPVLRLESLAGHITAYTGARRKVDVERIVNVLTPLRDSRD